jgi:outer membrane immunogenic protein
VGKRYEIRPRVFVSCGSCLLFGQFARAADLPILLSPIPEVQDTSSWTGPYIGAQLGYMFGSTSVDDTGVIVETNAPTDGFLGGVVGGYNWQLDDTWVVGIEGDASFGSIHGNGRVSTGKTASNSYDLNWTADLRGRIGYLVTSDTLLFAAAGLAWSDLRFIEGQSSLGGGVIRTGWSVGVGVDHAFTTNLVGKLEVLHADYRTVTYGTVPSDYYKIGFTANVVRGALMWKF